MAPCNNTPLTRIEKIKKNQVINRGSSPYNQMPTGRAPQRGMQPSSGPVLDPSNMTPVIPDNGQSGQNVIGINPQIPGSGEEIIPNAPTFMVPANPLLPEGYQEILDYNTLQYVNGFYRTQIGRYVRVEQLMGSNQIQLKEGYLIGVGINYIILQDGASGNIMILDIYGIKSMYVYYNDQLSNLPGTMALAQEYKKKPEK